MEIPDRGMDMLSCHIPMGLCQHQMSTLQLTRYPVTKGHSLIDANGYQQFTFQWKAHRAKNASKTVTISAVKIEKGGLMEHIPP